MPPKRFASLLHMLELNASAFLGAATALARLHQILSGLVGAQKEILIPESVALISPTLRAFQHEAQQVGAKLAVMASNRVLSALEEVPCRLTVERAVVALQDIESRFADHLSDVKMFALSEGEAIFLQAADELIEMEGFSGQFPNASFEVEEASKCLALGRHTAAVFHAMRMLELGIRALAKRLDIPDPTKAAEKNWNFVLTGIREKIDERWPRSSRMPSTEGAAFEALYATLDTVRNPWRNATMHVETIYAPHEALHILRCAAFFMTKLSELTNESGDQVEASKMPALPGLDGQ